MSGTWLTTRAWLLMLPLLVVMVGVIGWPLVDTVRLSFTDAKLVGTGGNYVGMANYAKMLGSAAFLKTLWSTPLVRPHVGRQSRWWSACWPPCC